MKWYDLIQSFLTLIIAIVVAWITYKQFKTDRRNVNLAIYEKRYKVYKSVMEFIVKIVNGADIDLMDIGEFSESKAEAFFLFDKDIIDHLGKIKEKAHLYQLYDSNIKNGIGEKQMENVEKRRDILNWFNDIRSPTKELFKKYLHYSSLK